MRLLSGSELVGFIKERQAKQVRSLRQAGGVEPKLVIIQCVDDPVTDKYTQLKLRYGESIAVEVEIIKVEQEDAGAAITKLNTDDSVHGIIVQLPLPDKTTESQVLNSVAIDKDVDGLAEGSNFDPATPMAINWLLNGYNIEMRGKTVAVVGQGRLVGAPLARMLRSSGVEVETADINTPDLRDFLSDKQIIITATGQPGLISADMLRMDAVVVDAGVASDSGELKGDLADDVYEREDLTLTPRKGGVGPLTVATLFDNVLRAAEGYRKND